MVIAAGILFESRLQVGTPESVFVFSVLLTGLMWSRLVSARLLVLLPVAHVVAMESMAIGLDDSKSGYDMVDDADPQLPPCVACLPPEEK